jgi:hypothetical protein
MPVHRVSVSARLIDFPARCACCGEPHDRTVHATAGRSGGERRNWAVPYCDRCLRHHEAGPVLREASDGVRSATVWLVVCLSLSAAASALAVASPSCGAPLLATCLLLAAVFWLFRRSRVSWRDEVGRELTRTFRRGCACEGPAVRYEGWSGSVHTFAFASEPYAADFERLNLAKVVQAPPVPVSVAARERSAPAKDTRAAAPPKPTHRCWRCGHTWTPRNANPAKCPGCGKRLEVSDGAGWDGGDSGGGDSD